MSEAEQPLAGLTGQGVRVAVIDSGVHAQHDHINAQMLETGCEVLRDGTIITGETQDELGHGTAVTAAIQEAAPEAICIPVKVFHSALKASPLSIISGIRWALEQGVDLINLSLGSRNESHIPVFESVMGQAQQSGVGIVSAYATDEALCYPGALPSALSVALDWDQPRMSYAVTHEQGKLVFRASGYPRPVPGVPPRRNLHGVSFAVAKMTAFAARACQTRQMTKAEVALQVLLENEAPS